MPKFVVTIREVMITKYEVEAVDAEEAYDNYAESDTVELSSECVDSDMLDITEKAP